MKYFAPFRIDLSARTLWRNDARVPLTHKAFDILRVLVERAGHVVAKDTLLGAVWPDTHVHPDNVKVLIGEIRRALGDDPANPQFIRSIMKRGYIFIAPVVDGAADLAVPSDAPIFVGRQAEMDVLLRASDDAAGSNRRLVFINGEAGVGKTSLCEAFLRIATARHTMRATWAQCVNANGPSEPYSPLIDILNRLARSTDDDLVGATLARHAPSWLPLLPALSGDRWTSAGAAPIATTARMLREVVSAIEAIAEQVFLLVWIEDVHWADPATIDVLGSLGYRSDAARLLLIATTRYPDSVPSAGPLRRTQADLVARARAIQIRLEPFRPDDVHRYLRARFDRAIAASLAPVLHRATGGNPLFLAASVESLMRSRYVVSEDDRWRLKLSPAALEGAIPASFATAVARELDELAPDERQAVSAASVIGVRFSLWLAAEVAGVEEVALEPALEMLARRHRLIVREGIVDLANGMLSPSYRFKHALYQEIVSDRMDSAARAQAHGRAGLATERLVAGREHEAACELAGHFHEAGDHARAVRYFRLAADNALKRYAPREAAALLHGAVAHAGHLLDRDRHDVELETMLELGRAQLASGETALATETLLRLERRAEEEDRPNDRVRALLALGDVQAGVSHEGAMALARRITEVASFATDEVLKASAAIRARITEIIVDGWSDETADRCFDVWRVMPRTNPDESRSLAIRLLFVHVMRSSYSGAWGAGRKLLTPAIRSGNLTDAIACCYLLGIAALHLGRWGDAADVVAEGAAIGERTGSGNHAASMRLLQAWIALEGQRWDDARRLSLDDRSVVEGEGWTNALQMSLLFGGAAAVGLGHFDEAAADLERLRDWYGRERLVLDWYWKPQLHSALAELSLRRGDLERAATEAAAAQDAAIRAPERTWRARAHVIAAQVALARKAFVDAERHLRQARRETRGIEAPLASWRIEAVTASLLDATAQPDSARRARLRYERAFDRLERSMAHHDLITQQNRGVPGSRAVH